MATDLPSPDQQGIERAGVVLLCQDFAANLAFFTETLGFRVETIHPADGPTHASLIGHGSRLFLEIGQDQSIKIRMSIATDSPLFGQTLTAPNGSTVEFVNAKPGLVIKPLVSSLVVDHVVADGSSQVGRAGMLYRDLVPGRQGGAIIASLISIAEGGPVPD